MSIFPEVYKKATSMINSPIKMPCEDGAMSVVPTNKAKEAIGIMQEEIVRLEQQLAKVNESTRLVEKNLRNTEECLISCNDYLAKANERVSELESCIIKFRKAVTHFNRTRGDLNPLLTAYADCELIRLEKRNDGH